MMEWINLAIAGVAALAAIIAAVASVIAVRLQRSRNPPLIEADMRPADRPDWWSLTLIVRNRDEVSWIIESVRLLRPRRGRIVNSVEGAMQAEDTGEWLKSVDRAAPFLARVATIGWAVDPRGTERHRILGGGDTQRVLLWINVPSPRPAMKFSARVNLRSKDLKATITQVTLTRELTAATASKTV
jgi:hypothetical protein